MEAKKKKKGFLSSPMQRENFRLAFFMMLPTVIILGLVAIYPPIRAFDISLHYNNLMKPKKGNPFIWFDNYKATLSDPSFWSSVKTTAIFVAASVALVMVMALLIAVLLNKKFPGRNFVRALMLVPWAIPTVVNGLIWLWILNPSYGALNGLLSQLGIIDKYIIWLGNKNWAMFWIVIAEAWKETPFIMLNILAALSTIPEDLYEAAKVDGATGIQSFFRITLPIIKPTLFICLTLRTIWALKSFDLIYTLTAGGPGSSTTTVAYYTYQKSFTSLNLGRGSAAAWLMTIVMIGFTIIYQRMLFKED